ncbi:MAG: 30S ribosomal protein S6 [Calditrichaeota bacterium]|nr:30S ribosomal protein S6 [Calditrichota bacterium]
MSMRTYEGVLVLDTGLDPEKLNEQLEKFQEQILHFGGLIRRWDVWGKKRLAYEIEHRQYGYYAVVVFDVEPASVKSLGRYLRLNSYVLRHLIVVLERHRIPPVEPTAQLRIEPEKMEAEPAAEVSEGEVESVSEESEEESFTDISEATAVNPTSGDSLPSVPTTLS